MHLQSIRLELQAIPHVEMNPEIVGELLIRTFSGLIVKEQIDKMIYDYR